MPDALALTPTLPPPPPSLPEFARSTTQELFAEADQETGRAQAPLSFTGSDCLDVVCPSGTENVRPDGDCSEHGACTVSATENNCGLPDNCMLALSVAAREIVAL